MPGGPDVPAEPELPGGPEVPGGHDATVKHGGEAGSLALGTPIELPAGRESPVASPVASIEAVIRTFLAGYPAEGGRRNLGRLAASRNLWREVSSLTLLQLVAFARTAAIAALKPVAA